MSPYPVLKRPWKRVLILVGVVFLLSGVVLIRSFDPQNWPGLVFWVQSFRRVQALSAHDDARWVNLASLDLRADPELLRTVGFNLRTRWPAKERLPPDFDPGSVLTNAMNPGLGVRELHQQGITGRGISVAIIDFNVAGEHPEYASQLVQIHRLEGVPPNAVSMHGPAVLSLLAGRNCGTAPEARVYFVATRDPGGDALDYANALDWILEQNRSLAPENRIRVVSISAAPSGPALYPFKNGTLYDAAFDRAETAGVLVIDGTVHHGFIGPCALDSSAPEDPFRCVPIKARGHPEYFAGRVLCPTSPRTTAEEYGSLRGYQYCGLQRETMAAAGSSWSMPYAAGVAALGWQLRPELTPREMRELLRATARQLPSGDRIIDPPAFIEKLRGK